MMTTGWKTALFSTLMLVSLIANASVIFTLSKFKQIRTATNIFIGSLACADICKCFSNAVFGIVLSYGVQDYVLGSVWCENEHFIKASKNIVTNMSIIAMVAGRLGSVLFAGQPLFRSVRAALISAIMMWILCVPSMYFLVRVYWKTQMHEIMWKDGFVQHVCLERNNGGKVFWIVLLFVQRYVPLILLLILYAVVWRLSRVYAGIQIQQPNGRHYLNNGILLVYVLIGIVLQIPSQVYFFMRMRDAKSDWHDVSVFPFGILAHHFPTHTSPI